MPKIVLLRDVKKPIQEHHHHKPVQLNNRQQFWQTYYQSPIWKTTRLTYRTEHPICERCLSKGVVASMTDIHHKCPFGLGKTADERWTLLTDKDNLVSLCNKCHHEVHTTKDTGYLWNLHDYYMYKSSKQCR